MTWTLVIHGGSGMMTRDRITPQQDEGARAALGRALDAGSAVLSSGGAALAAVDAAVRVLEDDPHFNAGRGAALRSLMKAWLSSTQRSWKAPAGMPEPSPVSLPRATR